MEGPRHLLHNRHSLTLRSKTGFLADYGNTEVIEVEVKRLFGNVPTSELATTCPELVN